MEECMFQDDDLDEQMHPCEMGGCDKVVPYDDEPYCYIHSSPKSAHMIGYSYIKMHRKKHTERIFGETYVQHGMRSKNIHCSLVDDDTLVDVPFSQMIIDENRVRIRPHYDGPCRLVITA